MTYRARYRPWHQELPPKAVLPHLHTVDVPEPAPALTVTFRINEDHTQMTIGARTVNLPASPWAHWYAVAEALEYAAEDYKGHGAVLVTGNTPALTLLARVRRYGIKELGDRIDASRMPKQSLFVDLEFELVWFRVLRAVVRLHGEVEVREG